MVVFDLLGLLLIFSIVLTTWQLSFFNTQHMLSKMVSKRNVLVRIIAMLCSLNTAILFTINSPIDGMVGGEVRCFSEIIFCFMFDHLK